MGFGSERLAQVDAGESYAERKEQRQQEIKALKDALQMLNDWKGF